MENKQVKISVAIPAYNEGKNIRRTVLSVLSQKEQRFSIAEVIVISDGSTDNTAAEVNSIRDPRIKLVDNAKRMGKSTHLNNIFAMFKGDLLVLFDADVILADSNVIHNLIQPLIDDSSVGLVGGNPIPSAGETFIEKSVNVSFKAYSSFRTTLRGGNNAFGCDGRILALSRPFTAAVSVPKTMIANDAFLYFACITKGFKFRHVSSAKVWFRSPSNLRDHLKQNKRFIAARYRLQRIYGNVVRQQYAIPKKLIYRNMVREFLRSPIYATSIFIINLYCRYQARKEERLMDAKWPMAISTKEGIPDNA